MELSQIQTKAIMDDVAEVGGLHTHCRSGELVLRSRFVCQSLGRDGNVEFGPVFEKLILQWFVLQEPKLNFVSTSRQADVLAYSSKIPFESHVLAKDLGFTPTPSSFK